MKKEQAKRMVRMFPSTYEKLRKIAFRKRLSYPELLDQIITSYLEKK